MQLTELVKLLTELKKNTNEVTDQIVKIEKIIEYFNLASASSEIYQEYLTKWIKHIRDDNREEFEFKAISGIFSLYVAGRVCLFITRNINEGIKNDELKKLNSDNKEWVKKFVDFRNNFPAHPLENESYYSELVGFGNCIPNLTVDVYKIKQNELFKSFEINPQEDIQKLHDYLEKLANIYEKYWVEINNSPLNTIH
jgi:hypothetical protein